MGAALLLAGVWRLWQYTMDDTFITLRYARNLADHGSPVFNVGGARAEGYSTFLWMVLLAVPHLVTSDAATVAKVLSVLLSLGAVGVASGFAFRMAGASRHALVAAGAVPVVLAAHPATALHAVSGMETALFSLLFTLVAFVAWDERGSVRVLAGLCLALGLTRPEGNLIALVALVAAWVLSDGARRRRLVRAVAVLYVLPAAVYFAWRLQYYREVFPLPYHLKVTGATFAGRDDVVSFLGVYAVIGLVAVVGVALLGKRALAPAAVCATLIVIALKPVHLMGIEHRYLYPAVPTMAALATAGAVTLAARPRMRWAVAIAAVLVIVPGGAAYRRDLPVLDRYAHGIHAAHIPLGRELHRGRGPIALNDVGAVGYYSERPVLDTFGLNDRHIATTGDHSPSYVLAANPRTIVLVSRDRTRFLPKHAWEADLLVAAQRGGFSRTEVRRFDDQTYLWVLEAAPPP